MQDEVRSLSEFLRDEMTGEELGEFLKNLDELEHTIHLEINHILNNDFKPEVPLANQKDVSLNLKEKQDLLIILTSLRYKALAQYRNLKQEDKKLVWENYLPQQTSKTANKNTKDIESEDNIQMNLKLFESLTSLLKNKVPQEIELVLFADLFKLLSFNSGYILLSKINEHLTKGKNLEFAISEDYLASLLPSNPDGVFAKQTDESRELVAKFKGHDLDDLKKHYLKEKNQAPKLNPDPEQALKKVVVTIPTAKNMDIVVARLDSGQVVFSVSPSYRALFHELTHAHRGLKGHHKRKYNLPEHLGLFFSKSAEELWTIFLGKTSERALSRDDKLPARITHASFTLYDDGEKLVLSKESTDPKEVDRAGMKILHRKIQAEILSGNRDFSGIKFNGKNRLKTDKLEIDVSQQMGAFKFEQSSISLIAFDSKISKSSFRDANLAGSHFNRAETTQADFKEAIFNTVRIQRSNLDSCDFKQASLSDATLKDSHFDGARFHSAAMTYSTVENCSFMGANFKNARISNTTFEGVDFSGVVFDNAVFINVTFKNCKFDTIVANKMTMSDCTLENVRFRHAQMDNCRIEGVLKEVNTSGAFIRNCSIADSHGTTVKKIR